MCRKVLLLGFVALMPSAAAAQAQDIEWIKAAYWDSRYPTNWAAEAATVAVRDGLVAAGYEVLDADQLKDWMDARIADKAYSVVVLCRDIPPDTVVEDNNVDCTLRRYLNAGGKIVVYADIPFYNQGHADGTSTNWGEAGINNILGVGNVAVWDTNNTVTITADGQKWGLTQTWASVRPHPAGDVDIILAADDAGNAAAWVKHYVPGDTFRGFVRIFDRGGQANIGDLIRVAEYIGLKATDPQPADGADGVLQPLLQWDPGSFALWHDVYFGTDPEPPFIGRQMWTMYFHPPGLEPGATYYWRIDEVSSDGVTIYTGDVWSFTAAPVTAYKPVPRDGDKWIATEVFLRWEAGSGATAHEVYFSSDADAVANRDASVFGGQVIERSYDPGVLQEATTYYWAVDEIASGTKHEGAVWSFTTIGEGGGGVKGEYFDNMDVSGLPALTRIDPAIDFSWGDQGPGAPIGVDNFSARWTADLEIAAADTYTFISSTDDGVRVWLNGEPVINQWVDQGTTDVFSDPLYLEPGFYSLRMEYYENGGGAVAQLSWQTPFVSRQIIPAGPLQPPARARALYPADEDVNVPQDVTLMWSPGERAAQHQIYLGDDAEAVANATPADTAIYRGQQTLDMASYTASGLEWNKTYYWRIDEANNLDPESPWKGGVWSFTTANYIVVDDFESYSNEVGNRVFQAWIDGLGYTEPPPGAQGNGTGALVGHDIWSLESPYYQGQIVEVDNPHGGLQAMPLYYNNSAQPYHSETERTWMMAQNWTVNEVDRLTLYVRGVGPTFVETGPNAYLVGSTSGDIWGTADSFRYVYKRLNGNGSIVAKVNSMTDTWPWAKAGVMIRESLDPGAKHLMVVVTPGNGVQFAWREFANSDSGDNTQAELEAPHWVKLTRNGSTFTAEQSADGVMWEPINDATNSDHDVTMIANVYVGLTVTSNNADAACIADFSDVTTSGGVSGVWQVADIGGDIPGNSPAPFYVALEDSAGRVGVAVNPDAVLTAEWTPWDISLSEFSSAGVNLAAVRKMYMGVGDRSAPMLDGDGVVFIDDIRVTRPAPEPDEPVGE